MFAPLVTTFWREAAIFAISELLAVKIQFPSPGGVPVGAIAVKGRPFKNVLLLASVPVIGFGLADGVVNEMTSAAPVRSLPREWDCSYRFCM